MTTTQSPTRPDTHDMIVVHRVFRRESGLLPRMVRAVPAGERRQADRIAHHFHDYHHGLHQHHTGEDIHIWPLLLGRVDLEAELVLRMEAQHEVVATTLTEIAELLPAWQADPSAVTAAPVIAALGRHRDALVEHLGDEEEYVLPLIEEHLTAAEYGVLGASFAEETPKDRLLFFLGALLEEADAEERREMMLNVPPPARVIWRLVGRHLYARRTRLLRAGLR